PAVAAGGDCTRVRKIRGNGTSSWRVPKRAAAPESRADSGLRDQPSSCNGRMRIRRNACSQRLRQCLSHLPAISTLQVFPDSLEFAMRTGKELSCLTVVQWFFLFGHFQSSEFDSDPPLIRVPLHG